MECESHGRDALEEHDASATLGWFTAYFPLRLERSGQPLKQAEALARWRAALPAGGAGFSALQRWRAQLPGADGLALFDQACALSFNYLGAVDHATDSSDNHPLGRLNLDGQNQMDVDPSLNRLRPITLEAWRSARQLTLRWTFQREQWPQADTAIAAVALELQELLAHTTNVAIDATDAALTANLDDDELSDLMNALDN